MSFRSMIIPCAVMALAGSAHAGLSYLASTDRLGYTGTVTRYATLSDAQSNTNPLSGPNAIPARAADAPYNTGSRDAGLFFTNDIPGSYSSSTNSNIFLTAWWYTTQANTNGFPMDDASGDRLYSGWGNSNNTNTGFAQLYDDDGSTDSSSSGTFSNFDGSYWTSFTLAASGANATAADDFGRLWHAPNSGGASGLTRGSYLSWDMNIVFGGLQGVDVGGGILEANNHPTSVTGYFNAIFENQSTLDPSLNGYYVANFTFNLDNWAFGVGDAALNGDLSPSQFVEIPTPGTAALLGFAGLMQNRRRRRA